MYQVDGYGFSCNVKKITYRAFKIGPINEHDEFQSSVHVTPEECKDMITGNQKWCFNQQLLFKNDTYYSKLYPIIINYPKVSNNYSSYHCLI